MCYVYKNQSRVWWIICWLRQFGVFYSWVILFNLWSELLEVYLRCRITIVSMCGLLQALRMFWWLEARLSRHVRNLLLLMCMLPVKWWRSRCCGISCFLLLLLIVTLIFVCVVTLIQFDRWMRRGDVAQFSVNLIHIFLTSSSTTVFWWICPFVVDCLLGTAVMGIRWDVWIYICCRLIADLLG